MATIRAPHTIRCVSYNVLANQFSHYHGYCPPKFLAWPTRFARILQQIISFDSDLLFLQEIEQNVYHNHLQATLDALGYDSLFCSTRPDPDTDFGPVLAFRRDRWQLFNPTSQRTCTFRNALHNWHEPAAQPHQDEFHTALQTHSEGAAMAMLYSKHGPLGLTQFLCAVSTHLHWDPRLPDIKAAQAAVLCSEVARFRDEMGIPNAAVVIGGDFNSLPLKLRPDDFDPEVPEGGFMSGAYSIMARRGVAVDNPDHPATRRGLQATKEYPFHDAGLSLMSVNAASLGHEPLVTNCTETFRGCLDYIFVSAEHCRVASALAMPYAQREEDVVPADVVFSTIPNERFPSDHLPVGGDIVLV